MTKFNGLEALLKAGKLTEQELEANSVTPGDFLKMRQGAREWSHGYAEKPKKKGNRGFRYVFVQERATGWMKDVPLATGWNLKGFRERRSPILLSHDYSGLTVAQGGNILKNQEYGGFASMIGTVEFPESGKFAHSDLVHDMVEAGLLNCGSVGFDVDKMRAPEEEEVKKFGLGKYSAIFEKCSLVEYSLCSVGAQPGAGVIYSEEGQGEFEALISGGTYDPDVVQEVREMVLQVPTTKTYHSLDSALAMQEFLGEDDKTDSGRMLESVQELGGRFDALGSSVEKLSARISALEAKEESDSVAEPAVEGTAPVSFGDLLDPPVA